VVPLALDHIRATSLTHTKVGADGDADGDVDVGADANSTGFIPSNSPLYITAKLLVYTLCSALVHRQGVPPAGPAGQGGPPAGPAGQGVPPPDLTLSTMIEAGGTMAGVLMQVLQIPCIISPGADTPELKKLQHGYGALSCFLPPPPP
jgi:hypothetical protein